MVKGDSQDEQGEKAAPCNAPRDPWRQRAGREAGCKTWQLVWQDSLNKRAQSIRSGRVLRPWHNFMLSQLYRQTGTNNKEAA